MGRMGGWGWRGERKKRVKRKTEGRPLSREEHLEVVRGIIRSERYTLEEFRPAHEYREIALDNQHDLLFPALQSLQLGELRKSCRNLGAPCSKYQDMPRAIVRALNAEICDFAGTLREHGNHPEQDSPPQPLVS